MKQRDFMGEDRMNCFLEDVLTEMWITVETSFWARPWEELRHWSSLQLRSNRVRKHWNKPPLPFPAGITLMNRCNLSFTVAKCIVCSYTKIETIGQFIIWRHETCLTASLASGMEKRQKLLHLPQRGRSASEAYTIWCGARCQTSGKRRGEQRKAWKGSFKRKEQENTNEAKAKLFCRYWLLQLNFLRLFVIYSKHIYRVLSIQSGHIIYNYIAAETYCHKREEYIQNLFAAKSLTFASDSAVTSFIRSLLFAKSWWFKMFSEERTLSY